MFVFIKLISFFIEDKLYDRIVIDKWRQINDKDKEILLLDKGGQTPSIIMPAWEDLGS